MKAISKNQKTRDLPKQSLDVYCRLRPVTCPSGSVCMKVIPPSILHVIPSSTAVQLRNGPVKEMKYTFRQVFDDSVAQKKVFETVALPLVENLLNGRNGLLFTYGVTGSGKTYTMTGTATDGGIMPRCIDTIFNSIGPYKTGKYVFKPDKLNGFEMQSEADALMDRQKDFLSELTPAKNKVPKLDRMDTDSELFKRTSCDTKISNVSEDSAYAVFVQFVEIYNNSVFDLLDDSFSDLARPTAMRAPQAKIIREDAEHNMFVHGVNEIEVSSAKEAFQAFTLGQKRRRIAHTALNAESSRAHTIFTIRVVQAPLDEHGEVVLEKKYMQVGQLSLVDLAGSERTNRTKNTGARLREAGNINNSLMTLRTCLEILRENQKGSNKMVPYRDSRLTHLFKSFFEGEGFVSMVVCVNPSSDDNDENLHVLKFAEMSQEVQITCPMTPKPNYTFTPRRRKQVMASHRLNYEEYDCNKENKESIPSICSEYNPSGFFSDIPIVNYISLEEDCDIIQRALIYLEPHMQTFEAYVNASIKKASEVRTNIDKIKDRMSHVAADEVANLKAQMDRERARANELESRIRTSDMAVSSYKRQLDEYDLNVKRLKRELSEKEILINKNKLDTNKVKEHFNHKMAQTEEKLKSEMERKLRSQKSALEFELRSKERRLREAKRVLSDEAIRTISATPEPERSRPQMYTPLSMRPPSPNFRSTTRKLAPAKRPRRSRSAETWLEHKPPAPTNLPTVLQPVITRRKSVTKLTDAKDVLSCGADRYCLVTQGQDSDGDLEARIYKGDIVQTTGGGAQVTFSDVEILKQKSPTSPMRKLEQKTRNPEQSCSVAMEGHRPRRRLNLH